MNDPAHILVLSAMMVIIGLVAALQNHRRQSRRLRKRFKDFEGEEQRMFQFLHDLGHAIEGEPSPGALARIIVDGIDKVVSARGGAIYLLGSEPGFLHPAYISEDCPPLIGIPHEIRKRAERDPKALESHLRLSRIAIDEGLLGNCLGTGEAEFVPDVKNHPVFRDQLVRYTDNVSALIAPLKHAGRDLGVLAVARRHNDGAFNANDFAVFRAVAEQSAFAIGNAHIHREASEKRVYERELNNAREVQRVLLPETDPVVPGFRISGVNLSARIISGDYYDFIRVGDGKFGVAIADVSGKGVPAGLLMSMCRSTLRAVAKGELSPTRALAAVNRLLYPDIREDMFISFSYAILDEQSGTVTHARAGHDPALLYRRATSTVERLRPPGLALGIDAGTVFERATRDETIELSTGDCILFYTDGVREALNDEEEEFGLDRMSAAFREAAPLGAAAVISQMRDTLAMFTDDGPQMDDITLVAIEKR
ncbi:MAG: SpoIIE family protein phosphatase [Luteolibacter sp.]|jgi:phosphoserine phosphatase RsbU/P